MNINVQITTQPHETLNKTAQEIADSFMTAVGGDEALDTVNVNISATAGSPTAFPTVPVMPGAEVEPPTPRTIG